MVCHFVVIWSMCVPGIVIGTVSITFEPSKPPLGDGVDISCELTASSSTSITWNFASSAITCGSGVCIPDPSPYVYSMSGNVFNLTLSSVSIGYCILYSCEDANDATDATSKYMYVAYFDKNEITTTEPGANTDGTISVTTGCVLAASDLTITWVKIENGEETTFTADPTTTARSTCSRTCHTEEDEKVTSGFTHTEYTGSDSVEVQYKVTISHSSYTASGDQFTWTSAKYKLKVACTSSAEPSPSYNWDNQGNNRILTVNSITTDRSSICRTRNTMQETVGQTLTRSATASLQISVLYPPNTVTLEYHYGDSSVLTLTTTLSIREGNPFTVNCISDSKPSPSYNWTGAVSSTSATLKVNSAARSHTGRITCNVDNVMTRTFANPDKTRVGTTSDSFSLQVLYPPIIGELQNTSVVEGSPVTVSCPAIVGNPPKTTYQWIRNGTLWKSSQSFTIDTTSRTDALFYTYEASITDFFIEGHRGQTTVTVNETARGIQFTCEVDSNPASAVKIAFDGKTLMERSNTKHISFIHSSITCLDAGVYTCEGNNHYGQSSKKSIKLFVKYSQFVVRESTQKTYVNVAFNQNQNNDGTPEADGDDAKHYKDLVGYSRGDRTTYEVLHDH